MGGRAMKVMVANTWPGIPGATAVADAWQQVVQRPWGRLRVDPNPSEAQLKALWQQISEWAGEKDPLLVLPGSVADPLGPGQTWADLAHAWGFSLLLTLQREAALSQAAAFAALLRQAKACGLGWVLIGSLPETGDPQALAELDAALIPRLEAQVGMPVLGRMALDGQILWDPDALLLCNAAQPRN
ncbi:hypothetical protein [Synechococcus sp. W55.2]|uniref:hypothetical protein n=1 Tax=Synechococcus sp. W55.2 TaxID=2964513 RepID=UPI0039C0F252